MALQAVLKRKQHHQVGVNNMASGMLMGAGLGAGTSMLSGQDPLQGAVNGGVMGGIGGGFAPTGVVSNVATSTIPAHLAQTGLEQAATNGLSSQIGGGFNALTDGTGMSGQYVAQTLAKPILQNMNSQDPQLQHTPMGQGISRPQVNLAQGGMAMNSNPRFKRQGLL